MYIAYIVVITWGLFHSDSFAKSELKWALGYVTTSQKVEV